MFAYSQASAAAITDASSSSTSSAAACAALVELLDVAHARAQPAEFCAGAELLLVAVRCQPGLAELLLFPPASPTGTTAGKAVSGACVRLSVLSGVCALKGSRSNARQLSKLT